MIRSPTPSVLHLLTAVLLCSVSLAAAAGAQSGALRVDLEALEGNRPARSLDASRIEALVGGEPTRVLALEPWNSGEARVVIYLDTALSRESAVQAVTGRLGEVAAQLVALGEVQLVIADPVAGVSLPPTRDPDLVENALDRFFLTPEAEDAIGLRRSLLDDELRSLDLTNVQGRTDLMVEALDDELAMLRSQQDELIAWMAAQPPIEGPSVLLLLDEGLGLDPFDHYASRVADPDALGGRASRVPRIRDVAQVAGAYGWTIVPLVHPAGSRAGANDRRLRTTDNEDLPLGFRLSLGGNRDRTDESSSAANEPTVALPLTAWQELSEALGSVVVEDLDDLQETFDRLRRRKIAVVAPPPDNLEPDNLELDRPPVDPPTVQLSAAGLLLRTPGHARSYSAPAVAEVRIRRALVGDEPAGAILPVRSNLQLDLSRPGRATADLQATVALDTVDLADFDAGGPWRISIGVHTIDDEILTRHEVLVPQLESAEDSGASDDSLAPDDPAAPDNTAAPDTPDDPGDSVLFVAPDGAGLRYAGTFNVPAGTDSATILVESLSRREWGFAMVDLGGRTAAPLVSDAGRPLHRAIRIIPPSGQALQGRVVFQVDARHDVHRVEYFLNGQRIAKRRRPPFEARIDLGSSGRTMQLVVAAFDRNDLEIERDRLVLNEPPDAFWVRIIEPLQGTRASGPTNITAQVKVPEGLSVHRVDFFWRENLLGSVSTPPYTDEVRIPVDDPEGFLRAEAWLTDGRVAEDVLLIHQVGFGEQIGVELVELYLVATDRSGKPAAGLERDDFLVLEDGLPQEIENFEVAGDLPITVGLAIDSSSSLFLRMPDVQRAAIGFVDELERERDRAFLVGFGSKPRLVTDTTRQLDLIQDGIGDLHPHGATAVWGAVRMSLDQLAEISGRKALVVFYDGDDEDEAKNFDASLRQARRAQVPIYLVLMNDEAARTQGRSFSNRNFVAKLDSLARAGGGRVFYVRPNQDLEPVFASIADELRSHYLITYYPERRPGGPLWRPVEVRVSQPGLETRTIEGRGIDW